MSISDNSQSQYNNQPKKEILDALQQALMKAVIAGGTTAMQFYQQPMSWPDEEQQTVSKNPSTLADLQATLSILHVLNDYISPICTDLDCDFFCLGEETHFQKWFQKQLPALLFQKILSSSDFVNQQKGVRIIIDGIDGTGNFIRGIPLFCSAAAIFIADQLRISAIYNPIRHVVYTAMIPDHSQPKNNSNTEAWEWDISNNHRIDLINKVKNDPPKKLSHEAIGIHLTRNNPEKIHEFLSENPVHKKSILEQLSNVSGGIYAFNSSMIAMVDVARGALGAYINNITHLWDIAAGEVLIRACGGKVTDFLQNPISYTSPKHVSVIVAKNHLYDDLISVLKV